MVLLNDRKMWGYFLMISAQMEQYIQKVQSVIGCKVVLSPREEIEEIHIVSDLQRSPKQILRDIEAILISEFDTPIDYKKVSIAQIKGNTIKNEQDPRLKLKTLSYNNHDTNVDLKIVLEKQGEFFECTISGIKTQSNVKRLVGKAVLRAVEEYLGISDVLVFEDSKSMSLTNAEVIVVSITSVYGGHEEVYTGSAKVTSDSKEALARATLDAINRHIVFVESGL